MLIWVGKYTVHVSVDQQNQQEGFSWSTMAFARACANMFVEFQYFSNSTNSVRVKYIVHVWVGQQNQQERFSLEVCFCNCVEFTSKRNMFVEFQYFSNSINRGWVKYTFHVWVDQQNQRESFSWS